MKKLIVLVILIFNVIPFYKEGKFCLLTANSLMAQMGEEEIDIRYPNGSHVVLWQDGTHSMYWDPVGGGPQPGGGGGGIGNEGMEPPDRIDYNEEFGPYEDLMDSEDEYWHIMFDQQEFWYEWDPLNQNWQLVDNGGGQQPNKKPKYYIKLNDNPHRYYEGEKIYVKRNANPVKLTLFNENGPVDITGLEWKRKDSIHCTAKAFCNFMVNVSGEQLVKVDSLSNKTLTKNPLIVTDKPMIVFYRGPWYLGNYAFDDSSHKHIHLRNHAKYKRGLEITNVGDDTSYVVPWMGLLDQSEEYIRIRRINIDSSYANDPDFWVELRPTINNIIVNQRTVCRLTYAELMATNRVSIYGTEWSANMNARKKAGHYDSLMYCIYAITNTGDTIGKMNISCTHPEPKQVVFVYVNTGNGFNRNPELQKSPMLDFLNHRSHGQLFRKWILNAQYSDTLDAAAEAVFHPEWLMTLIYTR